MSPLTVSGAIVSYHSVYGDPTGDPTCTTTEDLNASFDNSGMTGTLSYDRHCASLSLLGWTWWWTDTLPFQLSAVAVQP
jgi:hypothetical protein